MIRFPKGESLRLQSPFNGSDCFGENFINGPGNLIDTIKCKMARYEWQAKLSLSKGLGESGYGIMSGTEA